MEIDDYIRRHGGLVPTYQLLNQGWTAWYLARAVGIGTLVRLRQGWYSVPEVELHRQRATRVGGRLTCAAAAKQWGLWTREREPALHVAVHAHASRLRDPNDHHHRLTRAHGVGVHWDLRAGGTLFVVSPIACLIDMVSCEPLESVVAAADSALGAGLVSRRSWRVAIAGQPRRIREILGDVDPKSGSYPESVTRVRLRDRGIGFQIQVELGKDLRVDFLIGQRLVVEIDGRQHATFEQYVIDRDRDARLSIRGFRCLRFTGRQVLHEWPTVMASIEAAITRGDAC